VAKATELLDERSKMLSIRELLAGSTHFNDLGRSNPRMSPGRPSKRLRTLERAGVVRREQADVCDDDPGFEIAATVTTRLRTMIEIWRGELRWPSALRQDLVTISRMSGQAVPTWLGHLNFAALARPA
jgi:DNA-binding HxlR family transcriptional regulator